MIGPLRYCAHIKHMNHGTLALSNNSLGHLIASLANRLYYSQDKGLGCCKDIAQTSGKKVEPWPKSDPAPQPWRAECPQEPQPPNYDPYRIKVPDVVVPPLPPSNVKRTGVVYTTPGQQSHGQDQSSYQNPHNRQGYQQDDDQASCEEENKDSSFLGRLKGFFGKFRSKPGKGDSDAMMNDNREYQWLQL